MRCLDLLSDLLDRFDAALEWEHQDDPLLAPPTPAAAEAPAPLAVGAPWLAA